MTVRFRCVINPGCALLERLAGEARANVFATPAYARARAMHGGTVVLLGVFRGTELIEGATGIVMGPVLRRRLEISSTPALTHAAVFWNGVFRFCRRHAVWDIEAESFGAERVTLPSSRHETARRQRVEYVLDLRDEAWASALSANHRRNLSKARREGLTIRRSSAPDDASSHTHLMGASMSRRMERGEAVSAELGHHLTVALLASGAGELFQAMRDGAPVSSILVLRAAEGAYYQSAGTTPDGMACGASTFVIAEAAALLRREGVRRFSLGGAGHEAAGLQRFKSGFGAREVALKAAHFSVLPPLLRKARTFLRLAVHEPRSLARAVLRVDRFVAFAVTPPGAVSRPPPESAGCLERLSDDTLARLAEQDDELGSHAKARLARPNDAWAFRVDGQIAHIAWLIPSEHDNLAGPRHVKLRTGEAEITHCLTPTAFRGQGLYPQAIRALCQVAADRGVKRVIMITNVANRASQRGIEKAGLRRCGSITQLTLPWLSERASIIIRGHRRQLPPLSRSPSARGSLAS